MEEAGIKQRMGKATGAIAKGALAVALVATLSPTAALAAPSEAQAQTRQSTLAAAASGSYDLSRIVDGTYNGSATVRDVEDDFSDWTLKVAVTVSNHKITNVEITNTSYGSKSKNQTKTTKAASSIIPKIISNNSTSGIDTVSGATCSSKAIKEAVNNALANAKTAEPVTKTALASAIKSARAVEQGNKADEAYAALLSAIESAQKVASDESATQQAVDAAADALAQAVSDFRASADAQADPEPAGAYDLSRIADGTYSGTAVATPGWGEKFSAYDLTAQVTVRNHQITKVKLSGAKGNANKYLNRAANGKSGVVAQIVAANSTDDIEPVDGAEGSSEAIVAAVEDALANAQTEKPSPAVVDRSALTSVVAKAKAIEQGPKTDEAYATLLSAIADAQKVASDESATQDQVDAAADALAQAIDAFEASPDAQPAGAFDLSKIANGTYYGTAEVTPAKGARYSAYDLTAQVTVWNHQITKVKLSGAKGNANKYLNRAANGKSGVVAQIVAANSTGDVTPVYGAETESEAIVAAVEDALANA